MKIKIGQPGTQQEMLKKDKAYTEKLGDIEFSQIIDGWWAPTEHELIISLLKEII